MTETTTKKAPLSRLACALLALVMAVGICVPTMAFAAEEGTYTIEVEGYAGETYTAYKVFDVTYSGSGEDRNVSYTIDASSPWFAQVSAEDSAFTLTQVDDNTYTVTLKEGLGTDDEEKQAVIDTLTPVPDGAVAAASVTATGDEGTAAGEAVTVTLDVSDETYGGAGYYYVTTTLGSVVSIDSTTPHATIADKNNPPTVDKWVTRVSEPGGGDVETYNTFENGASGEKQDSATIGETLEYQVEIANAAHLTGLTLHDQVTQGLTFESTSTIHVYLNNYYTVVDSSNYTIVTGRDGSPCEDGCIFEIVFDDEWLDSLGEYDTIIVTYEVVVDEDAVVVHNNDAWLVYGANNNTTTQSETETDTYGFCLLKVDDEGNQLDGATFTLEDKDGNRIWFHYNEESNTYTAWDQIDDPNEGHTPNIEVIDGVVYIFGLEEGTYTLTEVVAPAGYNKLADPITVTIEQVNDDGERWTVTANGVTTNGSVDSDGNITWPTLTVENNAGNELPGTGGMGTTIFYIIGGILVVGAVVLLITRRRMSNRA